MKYIKGISNYIKEKISTPVALNLFNNYPNDICEIIISRDKDSDIVTPSILKKYKYYRITSLRRFKLVENAPFFKEFVDEILLNKYIRAVPSSGNNSLYLTVKKWSIDKNYIHLYNDGKKWKKWCYMSSVAKMIIYYEEYPIRGPKELEAIEYLEAQKYNL
jgi:hypothetical protein